ncbi:MAG: glycosyltransferase [Verrucomicrobiaceae bacterium]|nr:MAG: glycosyltransferase [Verrucomicrobiaceae bacterium]
MTAEDLEERWKTDGKFFRAGSQRVRMNAVTYGPFPDGWPESFDRDFSRIVSAGFNSLRLYELPDKDLLDAAARHGLKIFGGLKWAQSADFFATPGRYTHAVVDLARALRENGDHPALAGVYVGNEVPADLARWMGPVKVREAIEALIDTGRKIAPHLLFAYASYPSTEYLEPENADFTAFNVYLENEAAFRSYVKRLHHIAGDRPLVISEFGMDSSRNGLDRQAETLKWATQAALDLETAGMTVYAWSDRWWNAGAEVLDWDFGLTDRDGNAKPALDSVQPSASAIPDLDFSVIVCTRNGRARIGNCLEAIRNMTGGGFETIVVDDGSTDGTDDFVEKYFPWVRLLRLDPGGGLSNARNSGAEIASGEILAFTDDDCEPDREWIARLRPLFQAGKYAAAGGPNLPPPPRTWEEAVVCAAPGAPSHVMLDDEEAEHLPGCNIAVRKAAFDEIGGFDPQFHTAGDDVDFCWRLREAGFLLGFAPGAFVWHWRRPSLRTFLNQQLGYGRAERLLLAKHPSRFSKRGDARWQGFVYGGGPVRVMSDSVIYHGPMGDAGYQAITNRMLPLRGLARDFASLKARVALCAVEFLQPRLRAWARNRSLFFRSKWPVKNAAPMQVEEFSIDSPEGREREHYLGLLTANGWRPAGATAPWDLQRAGACILMATERGEGIGKRTLVRVWNADEPLIGKIRHTLTDRKTTAMMNRDDFRNAIMEEPTYLKLKSGKGLRPDKRRPSRR